MMKKVILTGATGFIGLSVVKQLIEEGNQVIILVRKDSSLEQISKLSNCQIIYYEKLSQTAIFDKLIEYSPDAFIHLAWKGVGGKQRNSKFQITENISLTLESIELAHSIGCNHWIGIGSQAEYGSPNYKVNENDPTSPTSLYGKAKLATCWASLGLGESLNIKVSWIRLFSTYGPGDHANTFMSHIIAELRRGSVPRLTACEQVWDYLYIDDAASGILSVLEKEVTGIFNLGSGQVIVLKEVAELIRSTMAPNLSVAYGNIPYATNQIMHLEADISKIHNSTGWLPKIDLEKGIEKTINYYNKTE